MGTRKSHELIARRSDSRNRQLRGPQQPRWAHRVATGHDDDLARRRSPLDSQPPKRLGRRCDLFPARVVGSDERGARRDASAGGVSAVRWCERCYPAAEQQRVRRACRNLVTVDHGRCGRASRRLPVGALDCVATRTVARRHVKDLG